jgi:hypothetical protein
VGISSAYRQTFRGKTGYILPLGRSADGLVALGHTQGFSIVILNEVKNLVIVQQRPFAGLRVTYAGLA